MSDLSDDDNENIEKTIKVEDDEPKEQPKKKRTITKEQQEKMIEARRAKIFYNWIVNAQDVKLIFLSGTPVINKPSEISILYNIIRYFFLNLY